MNKTSWILSIFILAGAMAGIAYYSRSADQPSSETASHNLVKVVRTSLQTLKPF
jgi:hypothetical protein